MPSIWVQLNLNDPVTARVGKSETPLVAAQRKLRRQYGWQDIMLGSTKYGTNQGGGEVWPIDQTKRRGVWSNTGSDPDTLAWWPA